MQRVNRPSHAPLGKAFFLFLGVAIVPLSLRLAGVQTSFSPRLFAAIDAWHQIAEVFGAGYHPGAGVALSALNDTENQPESPDATTCTRRELACVESVGESVETTLEMTEPATTKIKLARAISPKTALHRSPVKQVESHVAALTIQAKDHAGVFEALGALKLETRHREFIRREINKRMALPGSEMTDTFKMLTIPENLRTLIQVKVPVAPSASKTAACRVRSAFAFDRRYERARALPVDTPSNSNAPENSEL